MTGFLHPDPCVAYHDPIVDGVAQIGFAKNPSAYAAFADKINFSLSRGEQSGTAREKSGRRRNTIGPQVSGAGDLHAGLGQYGIQEAGEANEFEHEAVGR